MGEKVYEMMYFPHIDFYYPIQVSSMRKMALKFVNVKF